jgi:hypothetical protein
MGRRSIGRVGIHNGVTFRIEPLVGSEAIGNAPFLQIIRCHFHTDLVSREDMHAVNAHSTGEVTKQFVILCLRTQNYNSERGIWECFNHGTDEFDDILRHKRKKREMNRKKPWHPTEPKCLLQPFCRYFLEKMEKCLAKMKKYGHRPANLLKENA